jgi:FMN phosphatase YigB (HAD superfamily)
MKDELPSAVGFDLDNTLYEYKPCNVNAINAVRDFITMELNISDEVFFKKFNLARSNHKSRVGNIASSHSRLLYFVELLKLFDINDYNLATKLDKIFWDTYFEFMHLDKDALNLLQSIKKCNIKTYILTDLTIDIQHKKLAFLGVEKLFDLVLTSEEVGSEKPSTRGFIMASKALNFSLNKSWYIGDSFSKDIISSSSIDIRGFHISREKGVSFKDINKILASIK